jgi:hypothetical protein
MCIPFNADEVYVHFTRECSAKLKGSACWKIRAQNTPIVHFSNKNHDKRYCRRPLKRPVSLAETTVAKRLNRFTFRAGKKSGFRAELTPFAPANCEIWLPRSRAIHCWQYSIPERNCYASTTASTLCETPVQVTLKADGTVALADPVPEGVSLR